MKLLKFEFMEPLYPKNFLRLTNSDLLTHVDKEVILPLSKQLYRLSFLQADQKEDIDETYVEYDGENIKPNKRIAPIETKGMASASYIRYFYTILDVTEETAEEILGKQRVDPSSIPGNQTDIMSVIVEDDD